MNPADAEIYAQHAEELTRFATVLAGPSSAEDIVAAAVVNVFLSPRWPAVTERRAYLFKAVLHEARQQHRASERRQRREVRATAVSGRGHDVIATARPEVIEALNQLTVRQRAVMYLTYWVDLDVRDVAARLGLSVRTTERELTAGRRRMEGLLR